MQVAKNVTINRKKREPDVRGHRVPELDKSCPSCKVRFFGERIAWAYDMNIGGRSLRRFWCPWESKEVE